MAIWSRAIEAGILEDICIWSVLHLKNPLNRFILKFSAKRSCFN